MDSRAEKLAKARKKLRDHQEKKTHKDTTGGDKNEALSVEHQDTIVKNTIHVDNTITTNRHEEAADYVDNSNKMNGTNSNKDNMTEYIMFNQKCLEEEVFGLQKKIAEFDLLYKNELNSHNESKQKIDSLELQINTLSNKNADIFRELKEKDEIISELNRKNVLLTDENNNLLEQMDFTKNMITTKESENAQLQNQVFLYYNQLEAAKLQITQLSNEANVNTESPPSHIEIEQLRNKISGLEQKIAIMQQERENLTSHYEHYMKELTTQLNTTNSQNEELSKEVNRLSDRESSLIEQISDMEIRLQNFNKKDFEIETQVDTSELQKEIITLQARLEESNNKNVDLEKRYSDIVALLDDMKNSQKTTCEHDTLSVTKLTADITSDKLAAQRATEQNLKLKSELEDLQEVVIKMTKDKLQLTEMLTHEKNLSKELMLKLADIEEQGKDIHNKLKAKDEEMMRLQNESRELAKKYNKALEVTHTEHFSNEVNVEHNSKEIHTTESYTMNQENNNFGTDQENAIINEDNIQKVSEMKSNCIMQKEDAMEKLQERFMNIMDEVANLSDEKHRLEHIILQLQNETDTICEYVALYQQQRSLLKKRDEERTHQLKIFEEECNELKVLLGELHDLLFRLAEDTEIAAYLKSETRHRDMARIWELLKKLQNSSLINKNFKNIDLNSFYPCSCCSGKLIDV